MKNQKFKLGDKVVFKSPTDDGFEMSPYKVIAILKNNQIIIEDVLNKDYVLKHNASDLILEKDAKILLKKKREEKKSLEKDFEETKKLVQKEIELATTSIQKAVELCNDKEKSLSEFSNDLDPLVGILQDYSIIDAYWQSSNC